jgi:3-oxoacyl-[acyl-carrier-protein] synthase III
VGNPRFIIAGTGQAVPARLVASTTIDAELGRPSGWLQDACGVKTRHVSDGERQEDLAADAALEALKNAGLGVSSIDLVIFAAAVSRQPIPSTAPLVARRLGIPSGACTAFDINSTCLSFLNGLDVAISLLASGRHRGAVVVSAEIASRALPWKTDPRTAGLFGDGAAAAVVLPADRPAGASAARAARFETFHEGYELCQLAAGGTGIDFHHEPEQFSRNSTFQMDGGSLFKLSAKHFPGFVERLLDEAKWDRRDVDLVVPHQASPLALSHLVKKCGFARDKVVDIVASHGNQVAASIPTALHMARVSNRLPSGTKLLMLGTSAGVSFGGMAIEV